MGRLAGDKVPPDRLSVRFSLDIRISPWPMAGTECRRFSGRPTGPDHCHGAGQASTRLDMQDPTTKGSACRPKVAEPWASVLPIAPLSFLERRKAQKNTK